MGERAFFQIAVGLLPVLLFGGVLVDRDRKDESSSGFTPSDALMVMAVPVLGTLAILAEAISIGGAIGAKVETPGRILVIAVIMIAMVLIVINAATPRFRKLLAVTEQGFLARALVGAVMAFCIGVSAIAIFQINRAIQIGDREGDAVHNGRLRTIGRFETDSIGRVEGGACYATEEGCGRKHPRQP